MLCTACAVSSIYFPQYHREFGPAALKTTYTVYYWYADTSLAIGSEPVVMRVYTRDARDTNVRSFFLLEFSLVMASSALGGVSTVVLSCWTCAGYRPRLGSAVGSLSFFSFLCCCVAMSVSAARFTMSCYEDVQGDPSVVVSYHRGGFKLKEGFASIVAATGGFLFLSFAVCISNCASRSSPKYQPSQATIP